MHAFSRRDRAGARAQARRVPARAPGASTAAGRCTTAVSFDISCTVKAYYALKLAGDSPDAPHMRARARGDPRSTAARRAPTCSRASRWRCSARCRGARVPYIPVEIMLLPRWFPFHLDKVSYWSRTVMVPLLILCTRRPRAQNPRDGGHSPSCSRRRRSRSGTTFAAAVAARPARARCFCCSIAARRSLDPLIPRGDAPARDARALRPGSSSDSTARTGSGRSFPRWSMRSRSWRCSAIRAMIRAASTAKRALQKLLVDREPSSAYCQPCVSPVWDTALAALALQEEGDARRDGRCRARARVAAGASSCSTSRGDWQRQSPARSPGAAGRSSSRNSYYPDLDDTAVIVWAMQRARDAGAYARADRRVRSTGWSACRAATAALPPSMSTTSITGSTTFPFADHGALLDPPTSDVTARVVTVLAQRRTGRRTSRRSSARSPSCARSRSRTARGSAAGAPTTSTAPGRCSRRSRKRASAPTMTRRCGARCTG